uniref:Uncharacterized protein n=1 Tax=Anguilla anguilla TaxID=7936 RepID=A0A0E9SEI1_ANGAN
MPPNIWSRLILLVLIRIIKRIDPEERLPFLPNFQVKV